MRNESLVQVSIRGFTSAQKRGTIPTLPLATEIDNAVYRKNFLEENAVYELPNLQILFRTVAQEDWHGGLYLKQLGPNPFGHPANHSTQEGQETVLYKTSEAFGGRPYIYPDPKYGKPPMMKITRGNVKLTRQTLSEGLEKWIPTGGISSFWIRQLLCQSQQP